MKFLDLARRVLRNTNEPLSINEIWDIAEKKGLSKKLDSIGKTPKTSLTTALYLDTRKDKGLFATIKEGRYVKYYLKSKGKSIGIKSSTKTSNKMVKVSNDIVSSLSQFAIDSFSCYTKEMSKSVSGNAQKWNVPDLAGCTFLLDDWNKETLKLGSLLGYNAINLLSFSVENEIDKSNLQKSFFRCISNSLWANESYIVSPSFSDDDAFLQDLKKLCDSFGIGAIRLNKKNPSSSEIIFNARYKDLDLEQISKISEQSYSFKSFIRQIISDLESGQAKANGYSY